MGELGTGNKNKRLGRKRSPKTERSMVGVSGRSALIPFQHNNKQDYKEEPNIHRKDFGDVEGAGGREGRIHIIGTRRLVVF